MKRSKSLGLVALFLASLIVVIVVVSFSLPHIILNQIQSKLRENYQSCRLSIEQLSFSYLSPGSIRLENFRLVMGDPQITEEEIKVERVQARFSILDLVKDKVLMVTDLDLVNPSLSVTDGDKFSGRAVESDDDSYAFQFAIIRAKITGGVIRYSRNDHGVVATLEFKKINGQVDALGTTDFLKKQVVNAHAVAVFGTGGEVELNLATSLFSPPLRVDVALNVKNQDLSALTPFLEKNDGLAIKGIVKSGHGHVVIQQRHLSSIVLADYEGVHVKLEKTKERSSFMADVMTVGVDIMVTPGKNKIDEHADSDMVHLDRRPGESVIGFIVRGLKVAAMKTAARF